MRPGSAGILDALAPLDAGGLGLVAERFRIAPDGRRVADATVEKPSVPAEFFGRRDRTFPPEMLSAHEPVVFAMKRAARIGKAREAGRLFESLGGGGPANGSLSRSASPCGSDEALQLWQGLVDGTWSLVDRCEAAGKRYILACCNEPGVRDPKALTPREHARSHS